MSDAHDLPIEEVRRRVLAECESEYDEGECNICGEIAQTDDGLEPLPFCHPCGSTVAVRLAEAHGAMERERDAALARAVVAGVQRDALVTLIGAFADDMDAPSTHLLAVELRNRLAAILGSPTDVQ